MHWLAPFPPKPMKNLWPWMVSPALGSLGAWLRKKKTGNEHNLKEYTFTFTRTWQDVGNEKLRSPSSRNALLGFWILNFNMLFSSPRSLHTKDRSLKMFLQTLKKCCIWHCECSTLKTRSKGRCQNVKITLQGQILPWLSYLFITGKCANTHKQEVSEESAEDYIFWSCEGLSKKGQQNANIAGMNGA